MTENWSLCQRTMPNWYKILNKDLYNLQGLGLDKPLATLSKKSGTVGLEHICSHPLFWVTP